MALLGSVCHNVPMPIVPGDAPCPLPCLACAAEAVPLPVPLFVACALALLHSRLAAWQYDNMVSYFENVGAGESQTCFSAQRHIINSALTGVTDLTFADYNMDGAWHWQCV